MRGRHSPARSSSPWRWSKLACTPPGTPLPSPPPAPPVEEPHESLVDVFLRIRPLCPRERGEPPGIQLRQNSICVEDPAAAKRQWFDFEGIIDSRSGVCDQHKVFESVGELAVQSVLDGFDSCIFSLGQTGTGKTYTLVGSPEEPGLLPRALERLLGEKRCCRVSCLELHMDRVRDLLLADGAETKVLPEIRCVPGRGVYVSHLTEVVTRDAEDAIKHIHAAARSRAVARTGMNACSSRGHAVFQLSLEAGARLCIVDLAGRENEKTSGCSGHSLAELSYINRSLFHLTTVIQALAAAAQGGRSPRSRVPFRDSKLTLLLSEYLRSARTFLVATASPAASGMEETMATLRLAQAVRQITTRSRRLDPGSKSPRAPPTPAAAPARACKETPRKRGGACMADAARRSQADAECLDRFGGAVPESAGTPAFGGTGGRELLLRGGAAGLTVPALLGCGQSKDLEPGQHNPRSWGSSVASVSTTATRAPGSKAATEATTDSDRWSEESGPARMEAALQCG